MRAVGHPEREAQHRVIALFRNEPGHRYFSNLDAAIAVLETKLAKARQLKKGMMQELLTGRIRLV